MGRSWFTAHLLAALVASERPADHEPECRRDHQRRTGMVLDHAFDVRKHARRIMAAHVVGSRAQLGPRPPARTAGIFGPTGSWSARSPTADAALPSRSAAV